MTNVNEIEVLAKKVRKGILRMALSAGASSSHFGGSLSTVEILSTLYKQILKFDVSNPLWTERDRFILSKGHACLGFYAILYIDTFCTPYILFFPNESMPL